MKNDFGFISSIAVILLSMQLCSSAFSQAYIQYTYDAAGNRIVRQYFASRVINNNDEGDPIARKTAEQHGISVYPNPAVDGNFVTVVISSPNPKENEIATISVLDNTGKMLFTKQQATASPSQIDLNKYSTGVYYVKVMVGQEQLFYRIVKTK